MGILAAHLNDAGILVANDERILYREPGFALLGDSGLVTGAEAYANASLHPRRIQNRYWDQLDSQPLPDTRFGHLTPADLVSQQLADIWGKIGAKGAELAIAVPSYMKNENLGLLLGIANDRDIPLVSMVDAAVASTRRHYENAVVVHIDLSLHTAMMTRLAQDGQVQVDRAECIDDCGLLSLYDVWLKTIAEVFVQQSRFDPLHTAQTEQFLQQSMPSWLALASSSPVVPMAIEYGGVSHEAEIESLEFVAAAAPLYQRIVSNVRTLFRADELPALQLTDRASRMPGLADTLKSRVGGEIFILEPGAAARGLLNRATRVRGGDSVTLERRLPWDQAAIRVEKQGVSGSTKRPTHLLHGHNALILTSKELVIGSQNLNGERYLELGQEMPGVSRRHCVIGSDNGQLVVNDHSRYGTFLNGHRIDGSATLQTGDVIRIGTPGFEMRLIRAEERDGS